MFSYLAYLKENDPEEQRRDQWTLAKFAPYLSLMHPYFLWYNRYGTLPSEHDQFVRFLEWMTWDGDGSGSFSSNVHLDSIVNCLKEYESHSDEWDDCNTMHKEYNKTMNDFNEEVLKSLDSWFNQPKVHGDEYEDYVLVPLCSFAEDHLKKCDLFEPSELKVQDQQCFTYDGKRNTNVKEEAIQL